MSDEWQAPFAGENLAVMRGERLLFRGLSFRVGAGEALVLRGANGSGKTTLLRMMAGLTRPFAGRLTWGGQPLEEDPAAHRRRVAYVGHLSGLKAEFTVGECLRFEARLAGAAPAAVDAVSERLGLAPLFELAVRQLSAGQRRRVALARLELGGRPLWLLDEPATALDAANEAALWDICRRGLAAGQRLVVASHGPVDLAGASALAMEQVTA